MGHFLVFDNVFNAERYLKKLWPYQHLGAGFNDLRAQQINMCDITLFKLKMDANPSLTPDLQRMGIELKKIGVSLEEKWHKSYGNNDKINNRKKNKNKTRTGFTVHVNRRVRLDDGRIGVVRYKGRTAFDSKSNVWIGIVVEYGEGQHNG